VFGEPERPGRAFSRKLPPEARVGVLDLRVHAAYSNVVTCENENGEGNRQHVPRSTPPGLLALISARRGPKRSNGRWMYRNAEHPPLYTIQANTRRGETTKMHYFF